MSALSLEKEYARLLREPQIEALTRVIIAEAPHFPELGEELYRRGKEPYREHPTFAEIPRLSNHELILGRLTPIGEDSMCPARSKGSAIASLVAKNKIHFIENEP